MLFGKLLVLSASLTSVVLADVQFTSPAAGSSISDTTIDVTWQDSGDSPPITSLVNYQLFLCAGGNDADTFIQLATLKSNGDFSTSSISVAVDAEVGGSDTNAYFLKMISAATGGSVINYSSRFTLSAMTGSFPPPVQAGLKTVTGTAGPPTQNQIVSVANGQAATTAAAAGNSAAAADQYEIPYTMQVGDVRYAPMPPVPSNKITAKNASPQFPTSAWTVWQSHQGPPTVTNTVTQGQTFSMHTVEATMAGAPAPFDSDMQKFLKRWKD